MSQDAIVMLKADHKEVRALFREFQKSSTTDARKGTLVEKIIEQLTVHTYIENEVMYPRVRELLPEAERMVDLFERMLAPAPAREAMAGTLHLGSVVSALRPLLQATLALKRRYPALDLAILHAATPDHPRAGALQVLEGDRWMLTLAGILGDHPPTDPDGFLAFARSRAERAPQR